MAFIIKQNDTSPSFQVTLLDANDVPILLTGATVRLHVKPLNGGSNLDVPMTIVNPTGGVVLYDWSTGDTSTAGTYSAEIQVTYSDSSIETFPNDDRIAVVITPELF